MNISEHHAIAESHHKHSNDLQDRLVQSVKDKNRRSGSKYREYMRNLIQRDHQLKNESMPQQQHNLASSKSNSSYVHTYDPKHHPGRGACIRYSMEVHIKHVIYTNVFRNEHSHLDRVCLITQLTNSRLHMLQRVAEHWKGKTV